MKIPTTLPELIENLGWTNLVNEIKEIFRKMNLSLSNFLSDAPIDGTLYGRKDGDWAEVSASGGGLQPGDNVSELLNDANYLTSADINIPTLQEVVDEDPSYFLSEGGYDYTFNVWKDEGGERYFTVQMAYTGGNVIGSFFMSSENMQIAFANNSRQFNISDTGIEIQVQGSSTKTMDYIFPPSAISNSDPSPGNCNISYPTDKPGGIYTLATRDESPQVLDDFVDDTAAHAGGVQVGRLYHTAGVVKIRLS